MFPGADSTTHVHIHIEKVGTLDLSSLKNMPEKEQCPNYESIHASNDIDSLRKALSDIQKRLQILENEHTIEHVDDAKPPINDPTYRNGPSLGLDFVVDKCLPNNI